MQVCEQYLSAYINKRSPNRYAIFESHECNEEN